MKFLLLKWQEGVDKALHLPDVILCDIMMLVLDGYDVLYL
jgi:CheY-like chemotaxis protein